MTIKTALEKGFQIIFRNALAILIFYIVNLMVVTLLTIPMFSQIYQKLGATSASEAMLTAFDTEWTDYFTQNGGDFTRSLRASISGPGLFLDNLEFFIRGSIKQYGWLILCLGFFYITLSSFMQGGLMGSFIDDKRKLSVGRFFHLGGSYFNRFFSITATAALGYFLLYKLITSPLLRLFEGFGLGLQSEKSAVFIGLIGVLLTFFILTLINIVFDYGKIVVVKENKESAWEAIWLGLKFIGRHFGKTLGLYYVLVLLTLLIIGIFLLINSFIHQTHLLLIIFGFFIQQILIAAKIWMRLNFYGCQFEYYRGTVETGLPRKKKL